MLTELVPINYYVYKIGIPELVCGTAGNTMHTVGVIDDMNTVIVLHKCIITCMF